MKRESFLWFCLGMILGLGVIVASPQMSSNKKCETYKVSEKVATSYVLKPVVIKEKCSPVKQEQCENISRQETTTESESISQEEATNIKENKPERRRRHRRYRRYWK